MRLTEEQLAQITQQDGYKEIDHTAHAVPADGDDYAYPKEKPKRHKYGARKVEVDGIKFDSQAEANRYKTLKLLEQVGEIHSLELQPSFTLQDSFEFQGVKHRGVGYRADFKYTTKEGVTIVEDVKGMQTPVFKLKWKMLLFRASEYNSPIVFKIFPDVGKKGKAEDGTV